MTQTDPIFHWIDQELHRQRDHIELIASENLVSLDVMRAQGSVLTNKYAEGYAGRRYYKGCDAIDEVEKLAIERVTQLFGCRFANVQPHSGSQANQSVFLALLSPGDTFLGMSLAAGGHLTHGAAPNLSGKWFNAVPYGVDDAGFIDMAEVQRLARQHKPKLIIAGGSAYPRIIDFKEMRRIADEVGALLMVDMAHFAGLVAGKAYPSPFPHAHVVTSTTHKTLRGPRGGLVLTNDEGLGKKINSALFPGLQGGPLMHVIAAKAVAFQEALAPSFEAYAKQVCVNAQVLSDTLKSRGVEIVSGGTDSHIVLVNLIAAYQKNSEITGKWLADIMESVGLVCNKNSVPHDPTGPTITAGVRLGSPAMTTRGFKEPEFQKIGEWIADLIATASEAPEMREQTIKRIKEAAAALCRAFPLYPTL